MHGKYLVAESDGTANANRGAIGPWEKFTLVTHPDGSVSLRSHHGKYLVAESDGRLNANRSAIGPWEKFRVHYSGGGPSAPKPVHTVPNADSIKDMVPNGDSIKNMLLWGCNHGRQIFTATVPPGGGPQLPWKQVDGSCVQLDSSAKWVFCVNKNDNIYRRPVDNSAGWTQTDGRLTCVSVTDSGFVWGCNRGQDIYTARADASAAHMGWVHVSGKCVQIHASSKWVYCVNKCDHIYRKPVDNSAGWTRTDGLLTCVSVTDSGYVWGCNRQQNIYYARADAPASKMGWAHVSGKCVQIHACGSWVYCVNSGAKIYRKPVDNSAEWTQCTGGLKWIAVQHAAAPVETSVHNKTD